MRILAGIVSYNPDIERLKENINAIYDQVDWIVIVENGSENRKSVSELAGEYQHISLISNEENKGIAAALHQIMGYAIRSNFDWVLSLDQDSVCRSELINHYLQYIDLEDVGILTCNIIDRNFKQPSGFEDGQEWKEIQQCITSASFTSVAAYTRTDGYDQKLFIDSVDFDMCFNMRLHGFKVIKINYDGILHEVGHGKNVKLFAKDYITYNHSPSRQYYMARNHMYLVSKYPGEFSRAKEIVREIRAEVLILLYEENKVSKLKARWKGLRDVKNMYSSESLMTSGGADTI